MEQLTYERLKENLARLKLARMNEVLDTTIALAEQDKMSYLSFLGSLYEPTQRTQVGPVIRTLGLSPHTFLRSPFTEETHVKSGDGLSSSPRYAQ
jgi:hypothetical protein